MNATETRNEAQATIRILRVRSIEDTTRIPVVQMEGDDLADKHAHAPKHAAAASSVPERPTATPTQDVFERSEKKYLISADQYASLMQRIQDRMGYDRFGQSLISSLYYDTPSDELVNRSLEKPLYKEKIRVRAYGEVDPTDRVFVELKKKFKGIVYKRRMACSLLAATAYMDGMPFTEAVERFPLADEQEHRESMSPKALQIAGEIDACKDRHPGMRPAMMIVTNRMALRSTDGSDVRITFDIDPVFRTERLTFDEGFDGQPLQPEGTLIMEIKCLRSYPLWLVHALSDAGIYPVSCTKYGRAYELSHPKQLPRVSTEVMTWSAPEPKRSALANLLVGTRIGRDINRKKGASCA